MLTREMEQCEAARQERSDKSDQIVAMRARLNELEADGLQFKALLRNLRRPC